LTAETGSRPIHVVAAAVTAADGRVLIAQRPTGKHLAGGWEFPGGKLEPGEARTAGLARELHEELGIVIRDPRPLVRVRHSYPVGDVLIDMWVVTRYTGEPLGLDGQALRWCTQDELQQATTQLLPADGPIVRALRLPERLIEVSAPGYVVHREAVLRHPADGGGMPGEARLHGVLCANADEGVAAVRGGAEFLALRDVVGDDDLTALCAAVAVPVFARGVELERAWVLGASGVNEIGAEKSE
jgi:8-oxo-dGTP diphosphatase